MSYKIVFAKSRRLVTVMDVFDDCQANCPMRYTEKSNAAICCEALHDSFRKAGMDPPELDIIIDYPEMLTGTQRFNLGVDDLGFGYVRKNNLFTAERFVPKRTE